LTYEPLLFVALIYICLTAILVLGFRKLENMVPVKGA
jgi:polar amino acid transport system permease protein